MPQTKEYKRDWIKRWRAKKRAERMAWEEQTRESRLLARGHCPVCEIVLAYEQYHYGCPYYENVLKPQKVVFFSASVTTITISTFGVSTLPEQSET